MSTYIYIPKDYTIEGKEALVATISSPLTYKSAEISETLTLGVEGYICAYGEGENLIDLAGTSSTRQKLNAWCGELETDTVEVDGRVVHLAPCDRFEFPNLTNSDYEPLEFGEKITFNNSISGTGQFIGRSVVRKSRSATIEVVAFKGDIEKLKELRGILDAMIGAPFYVQTPLPLDNNQVIYGWIESTPRIKYLTDYGLVSLSFEMVSTL